MLSLSVTGMYIETELKKIEKKELLCVRFNENEESEKKTRQQFNLLKYFFATKVA